jgi:CheY-like chemotaxis protein
MRILILDDDVNYRGPVAKMYRVRGHDVVDVTHSTPAKEAIAEGPAFDLIISDYNFGGFDPKNGVEIITELRELTGADTRYVICSAVRRAVPEWATFVDKGDIECLIALAGDARVTS